MRQVKPQPSENHRACSKCGGTGFYCMGLENGNPFSRTGFVCYPCNGTGWIERKPKRKRCKRCGLLFPSDQLSSHQFRRVTADGEVLLVTCEE